MRHSVAVRPRTTAIPFSVEKHAPLSKGGFSRAVVTVSNIRKWGVEEVASAFAEKGLQLKGFFKSEKKDVFHAFLAPTKSILPIEEASVKGMTEIATNIFADADDAVWDTVEVGSGKFIVKRSDTSSRDLLEALRARGEIASIHNDVAVEETASISDMVLAFDSGELRTGLVTAEGRLFDINTNEFASFDNADLICVYPSAYSLKAGEIASVPAGKRISSYNKSLFKAIEESMLDAVKVA